MEDKEINALIRLLDDTDREVYNHIKTKLISYGKPVVPFLENAWSNSFDALLQQRIETIVHNIQFETLKTELLNWYKNPANNTHVELLNGAILLAHYQYPDLDEQKIMNQINKIKRDVWLELNDHLTALEKVKVLNKVIFEIHGFAGNTSNYHAPQNSFINIALESKKGNPLMLSIIYSAIAQSLDIPIYGVNLPEHFVLAYQESADILTGRYNDEVLFYINAFSRGIVFDKKEINTFLKQLGLPLEPSYFVPCSNKDIILRLIRNLSYSYQKLGDTEKTDELEELAGVLMKNE
jgi:regulator of sirC expression with transglutaminase-like and TPR domain